MIRKSIALALAIFATVGFSLAKTKSHKATPAESVVQKFQAMVEAGSLLTPEGWKEAGKLFDRPVPYPKDSKIRVMYPGITGEWPKGQEQTLGYREGVVVEAKWGTDYGSIDSRLRLHSPEYGAEMPTIETYHLLFVDHQWKLAGPLLTRSATPNSAIEYITKVAEQSSDPLIKRNSRKTIAVLKRLQNGHSKACAC